MKRKILGVPLSILLIVGAASAAIIIATFTLNIGSVMSYEEAPDQGLNFEYGDGEGGDEITYQQLTDDTILVTMPLYPETEDTEYRYAVRVMPFEDGNIVFSDLVRTDNGITASHMQFDGNGAEDFPIEITTEPTTHIIPVTAGSHYYVSFKISTGINTSATEEITFGLTKT